MGDYNVTYKMFKIYMLLQMANSTEPNTVSVMFIAFFQAVEDSKFPNFRVK